MVHTPHDTLGQPVALSVVGLMRQEAQLRPASSGNRGLRLVLKVGTCALQKEQQAVSGRRPRDNIAQQSHFEDGPSRSNRRQQTWTFLA